MRGTFPNWFTTRLPQAGENVQLGFETISIPSLTMQNQQLQLRQHRDAAANVKSADANWNSCSA
jgi:hypothetical protein